MEESPSLIKDGTMIRCKSVNHLPIVAIAIEPRKPDDPLKASEDRLQTPGARSSEDGSYKVPQTDDIGEENPGQASGDRLHFPGSTWNSQVLLDASKEQQNASLSSGRNQSHNPNVQASGDWLQ